MAQAKKKIAPKGPDSLALPPIIVMAPQGKPFVVSKGWDTFTVVMFSVASICLGAAAMLQAVRLGYVS